MHDPIEDPFVTVLSPGGDRRREEIRRDAQRFASQKRRRRTALRAGGLAALFVAAWLAFPREHPEPARQIAIPRVSAPEKSAAPSIVRSTNPRPPITIARIQTDPTLTSRLAIPRQSPTWQTIGDDALLKTLADAGKPAGLAYADGRTIIMFRQKTGP